MGAERVEEDRRTIDRERRRRRGGLPRDRLRVHTRPLRVGEPAFYQPRIEIHDPVLDALSLVAIPMDHAIDARGAWREYLDEQQRLADLRLRAGATSVEERQLSPLAHHQLPVHAYEPSEQPLVARASCR
jgi:hypothetical protein